MKIGVLDQVHFKKIYNNWISQHFFHFAFLKKITTTGSSLFISPNGQGLNDSALSDLHIQLPLRQWAAVAAGNVYLIVLYKAKR